MDDRPDVIAVLEAQHRRIRELFGRIEGATGDEKEDAFRELVRLLAVHETAEEEVVHPAARTSKAAESVVDARLEEEHRAKELLSTMDKLGTSGAGFDALLAELRDAVLAHADNEEREEFPRLRAEYDATQLRGMAIAVQAAEQFAPTRPHPGVESAAANVLLGPAAAITDRARDAIRAALKR